MYVQFCSFIQWGVRSVQLYNSSFNERSLHKKGSFLKVSMRKGGGLGPLIEIHLHLFFRFRLVLFFTARFCSSSFFGKNELFSLS